jgi:hypothetical protein
MPSPAAEDTLYPRWQDVPHWKWLVLLVLAAGAVVELFSRFRAGAAFLVFFDDDYFYYLRIAQNIAAGRGSTFDGIHQTNGYHPLWLLVNVALASLFSGRAVFIALLLVILLCALATYWLLRLSLRRYGSEAAAAGCAGLITAQALFLMSGGMEIVLSIPLLALLCWYRLCRFEPSGKHAALYGLLCSALVLARLDSAIFVAQLALFELLAAHAAPRRKLVTAAVSFLAGLLPLLVYFALNLHLFHTLMPVSGQAKQLRLNHLPSASPWATALLHQWTPLRLFLVFPVMLASVWAALLLRGAQQDTGEGRLACQHRPLVWTLMCFPFTQIMVLSVLSNWVLPPWYLYSFVGAACGIWLVLLSRSGALGHAAARWAAPVSLAACAALLIIFAAVQWRNSTRPQKIVYSVYFAARDLHAFAMTHPGIYAMGDHAGIPGMLIDEPILQTEGLVMDKPYLSAIRQQQDLKRVLESYGVRYYVASNPEISKGCLEATEPSPIVAGPSSDRMRGTFCSTPVDHFSYNGRQTYVLDLERERALR